MKNALTILALFGASFAAYGNTLHGEFLYDDRAIITNNPLIRDLHNLPLIFGTSYWGTRIAEPRAAKDRLYRPLTVTSFAVNYWVGKLNPFGYHLENILFHAGAAMALFFLALRLGLSRRASIAAAFLFVFLPVHTEAVSSVEGRAELLAAFFLLTAWILAMNRRRWVALFLGPAMFALALLSKENAAMLLPTLVLADYFLDGRPGPRLLRERGLHWIVYAGVLLLFLEWKYLIVGSIASTGGVPYFREPLALTNLLTMGRFVVQHYLKTLVLGIGFCADFTRPMIPDAGRENPVAWICLLMLLAMVAISVWSTVRRRDSLAFSVLLFFVLLFPVSNLAVRIQVIGAERFLYLPSIGYCLALGICFDWVARYAREEAIVLLAAVCLWYGWATIQRNRIWQSEKAFWTAMVQDAPLSARAWNGMGLALLHEQKYDEAILHSRRALALDPQLIDASFNIALCHYLQHHDALAKAEFLDVLRHARYDTDAMLYLGYIDEHIHNYADAAQAYSAILRIDPLHRPAKRNLALLHCRTGKRNTCRAELSAFLKDAPPEEANEDLREYLNHLGGPG